MMYSIHCRLVIPATSDAPTVGLWKRFLGWLMEVPPNPLVWYAPCEGPAPKEKGKTTLLRLMVLVFHDDVPA